MAALMIPAIGFLILLALVALTLTVPRF